MSTKSRNPRATPAFKAKALELADQVGPSEAARRLGLSVGTIASWRSREKSTGADVSRVSPEVVKVIETVEQEQWSDVLVSEVADTYGQAAREFLAASRELLRRGRALDAKTAMLASAIAADKAQLLSGAATSRHESHTVLSAEVGSRLAAVLASVRQGNGLGIRRELASDQHVYVPAEGEVVVDTDMSDMPAALSAPPAADVAT